jgi:Coenzyme PQQ synthesis protein D (PqqD)
MTERFKDATVKVPEHVVYRSFEAEILLLNLETGQYHGLNPTGGRMMELLKETDGSLREATERLAGEVEMTPEEIADDLASFCADLVERGLMEVHESGEGSGNSS